jgi:WD40 repeat protein
MDITPHEISAFDFDFLQKRMLIGDTKGNIALYNTANGAKMKSLTKHNGEITHLLATQHPESKADVFISYGLDNEVRISRETEESFEVIRTIYINKEVEVTCMKFCPENRIIMLSTNSSNLSFFDIETGKNIGNYWDNGEEFTSITRISKEVIVATAISGWITLLGIPPCPYRFDKITSYRHSDP